MAHPIVSLLPLFLAFIVVVAILTFFLIRSATEYSALPPEAASSEQGQPLAPPQEDLSAQVHSSSSFLEDLKKYEKMIEEGVRLPTDERWVTGRQIEIIDVDPSDIKRIENK